MNYTFNSRLLSGAASLRDVLSSSNGIVLDLSESSLGTVCKVMFCAMWLGVVDGEDIYDYLVSHKLKAKPEIVRFLLDAFEGDDSRVHLWRLNEFGMYAPLLDAMPEALDCPPEDFSYDWIPD